MAVGPCQSFDVTIPVTEEADNYTLVGMRLAGIAWKFVFQRETGANGHQHYQVRLRARHPMFLILASGY